MKRNFRFIPLSYQPLAIYLVATCAITTQVGCSTTNFSLQRSHESGYASDGSHLDRSRYYTSGEYNQERPFTDKEQLEVERMGYTNENAGDDSIENQSNLNETKASIALEIRRREEGLSNRKEQLQYSKALPYFSNNDERLEFLNLSSFQAKQIWLNKKGFSDREKNPDSTLSDIANQSDVAVGMTCDLVKTAWGEPDQVETAGNPIFKNERWKYQRQITSVDGFKPQRKVIYFESGKVVGWETDN